MTELKTRGCTVEDVSEAIDKAIKVLKVERYGVDVEVFDEFLTGSLGSYNTRKELISLNVFDLVDAHESYGLPVDIFVASILAHEIGHHIHLQSPCGAELRERRKMASEISSVELSRVTIEAEKKAWEYGSEIIPSWMQDEFDYLNKINLARCSYWRGSDALRKSDKKLKEKYGIKVSQDNNKN